MGRPPIYGSNAERQRAYRERVTAEIADLKAQLRKQPAQKSTDEPEDDDDDRDALLRQIADLKKRLAEHRQARASRTDAPRESTLAQENLTLKAMVQSARDAGWRPDRKRLVKGPTEIEEKEQRLRDLEEQIEDLEKKRERRFFVYLIEDLLEENAKNYAIEEYVELLTPTPDYDPDIKSEHIIALASFLDEIGQKLDEIEYEKEYAEEQKAAGKPDLGDQPKIIK